MSWYEKIDHPKYKYRLTEPVWIRNSPYRIAVKGEDHPDGWFRFFPSLRIEKGYAWDGPSGPTIDTEDLMTASLAHDVCYQALRERLLPRTRSMRKMADKWYRDLAIQGGAWKWRAKIHYRALRLFGWRAARMPFWK
jgi:hypothetical protein